MRIAIKYDDIDISSGGRVAGHEAGDTLVRRLLRIFPESIVIAPVPRQSEDFDVVPLEGLDPTDLVVINMDAVDSPHVWQVLSRAPGTAPGTVAEPRIMNFVWRPMPSDAPRAHMATLALSCALFPTFADSQRTANEVRELVAKWTAQHLYEKSRLSWVNLGFRLDHIQPRAYSDVPIVLYPSIYLTRSKHPEQFFRVIEQVRRAVPLRVEMRLQEDSLVSEAAMSISQRDWVWMGPLTATRRSYWEALARTTAFLATADKESYGLLYVEALGAGVIGVLPDREWAHALVPPSYPFIYRDLDEAATSAFNSGVCSQHAVPGGALRSFAPGVLFEESDDGARHRLLTAQTLADDKLRKKAGQVLERRIRAFTNDRELERRTRRYLWILGQHFDEIVFRTPQQREIGQAASTDGASPATAFPPNRAASPRR